MCPLGRGSEFKTSCSTPSHPRNEDVFILVEMLEECWSSWIWEWPPLYVSSRNGKGRADLHNPALTIFLLIPSSHAPPLHHSSQACHFFHLRKPKMWLVILTARLTRKFVLFKMVLLDWGYNSVDTEFAQRMNP